MEALSDSVVFFDVGNTLASLRLSAAGDRIKQLAAYPDVFPVLEALRAAEVRLGIITDPGLVRVDHFNEAMQDARLLPYFEEGLLFYGRKNSPRLFEEAAAHASQPGCAPCGEPLLLFVCGEAGVRVHALAAGFRAAPHPALALRMILGRGPLRYLRVRVPPRAATDWWNVIWRLPLVPLHLSGEPGAGLSIPTVFAIGDDSTARRLDDLGCWVDRLGGEDEPQSTDLFLLREDSGAGAHDAPPLHGSLRSARRVLASTHEGLIIAFPGSQTIVGHPDLGHRHCQRLLASMALLEPPALPEKPGPRLRQTGESPATQVAPMLSECERRILQDTVTAKSILCDVERYSGLRPVRGTTTICSRHINHLDNETAVSELLRDLEDLEPKRLSVCSHPFIDGRLRNVEARLPGTGASGIAPEGIVIVSAHLDSIVDRKAEPEYRADTHPAPGADDDASGMAGVLGAARALLKLDAELGLPHREVRFVLFNAEEHGLEGSIAYADDQARCKAKILAVLQMDMIGHDVEKPHTFELHAGIRDPNMDFGDVQVRSLRLAHLVEALVPQVATVPVVPQVYPAAEQVEDRAQGQSDHTSFQIKGYAACLASEDFYEGPGTSAPVLEKNPNYHRSTDTSVNADYAADIARAVAAAAWVAATQDVL